MTITKQAVRLYFTSPLHLAKGKSDYESGYTILHSDTLKSALFACARQLYGEQIEQAFLDGFTISSAFPFFKGEYFFPKPFSRVHTLQDEQEDKQAKKLKRIVFFGKSYFEDLLLGQTEKTADDRTVLKKKISSNHLVEGGKYVSEHSDLAEATTLIKSTILQRVSITPTYGEEPRPFYVERMFFTEEAGLFFLVDFHREEIKDIFWAALHLLGENGIGTDKNVGNGQFEIREEEKNLLLSFQVPADASHDMNLSLYCPLEEEIIGSSEYTDSQTGKKKSQSFLEQSSYNLMRRGGYVASPENEEHIRYRKRSVHMFSEGSVFPRREGRKGNIVNLQPEQQEVLPPEDVIAHPIWRDGRAMFFPIKITN